MCDHPYRPSSVLSTNASRRVLPSQKELSQLARDNPQAFEALRSELIENVISSAPERLQLRLRQLQFRIDGIRRRSGSPLGALLKIQALMWESFLRLDEALQHFDALTKARQGRQNENADSNHTSARIIEFQARVPISTG